MSSPTCASSKGAEFVEPVMSTFDEPNQEKPMSRAQKKNARKKQKKREKASELLFEVEEITSAVEQASLQDSSSSSEPQPPVTTTSPIATKQEASSETTSSGDSLKKIRALRKKLKQIEDLESRIASGEILKPDKDQLNKIAKKEGFLKELEDISS